MFDWAKRQGGLNIIDQQATTKSSLVYQTIEQSNGFYVNGIQQTYRSRVNIPFRIVVDGQPNEQVESLFLSQAIRSNMIELKGHRAVGGIRISLYNGMTVAETEQLVEFMRNFQISQINNER
jgi:phosphoserine aminotransferase